MPDHSLQHLSAVEQIEIWTVRRQSKKDKLDKLEQAQMDCLERGQTDVANLLGLSNQITRIYQEIYDIDCIIEALQSGAVSGEEKRQKFNQVLIGNSITRRKTSIDQKILQPFVPDAKPAADHFAPPADTRPTAAARGAAGNKGAKMAVSEMSASEADKSISDATASSA